MIAYSIMQPERILVINPNAALNKEDFEGIGTVVDAYFLEHAKLNGVLIYT